MRAFKSGWLALEVNFDSMLAELEAFIGSKKLRYQDVGGLGLEEIRAWSRETNFAPFTHRKNACR